ncbi:Amidophosphoribosyltransferase [Nymphon striatum]|nr:Amidophosphoribosyltransferase [Nymphon striatum]
MSQADLDQSPEPWLETPFDDDKLKEECGVFGVIGAPDAANFVALGHIGDKRRQARRFGYVRDNFTSHKVMETLPGSLSIGHPFYGDFSLGGAAIAHNGNITNADALRTELLLRKVEGAFSVVAMTRTKLIGVRDPLGVRPLVLGKIGYRQKHIEPGEMVVITDKGIESHHPFRPAKSRFCIFEHVYFSRPDSILGGRSVYETRENIGRELAKENPVEADLVCPVPDSGTPAAIGYSLESGIPYAMGIIRNQYMGRTFIEPTEQIRNMGVRLKLNVNRALIKGKRVILVDDSVVRGTTSRKIMILDAGAAEVHFRIASPPTAWPCFYGVDTPQREKLLAATMSEDEMRDHLGVDSLKFISLDGLYRAVGQAKRDNDSPQYCDACFSGEYPVAPSDQITKGFELKAAE